MYLWTKRVPFGLDAQWIERLGVVVGPGRLAVIAPAAGRSVRLEVYCATALEADTLTGRFGGRTRELQDASWQPSPSTVLGRPLRIGQRLLVTGHQEELSHLRAARPDRRVLCIPAAMAFGTGEHATTAMCLRLLMAVAGRRSPGSWAALDLGSGSGILALASTLFGARRVLGLDNDPHAVRTARENARLNGVSFRAVRFARAELPNWRRAKNQMWPVVIANLFSDLLIRLLPSVIAPAITTGGDLILSGVLATQADEVVTAAGAAGFTLVTIKRRGRWRAFHCCKS